MALTALILVLLSSVMHATWNAIVKASPDRLVATWGVSAAGAVLTLPALLRDLPSPEALRFLAISGTVHTLYNVALASAYTHGDLSLVYPIARGIAPVLATGGAWLLLGESLPVLGYVAIGLIATGVLLLSRTRTRGAPPTAVLWAIATSFCIGTYTLVDRRGVQTADPLTYIAVLSIFQAALTTVYVWARRRMPPWRLVSRQGWRIVVGSGALGQAAYLLVLIALSVTATGYVAALRETSVLFASWLGWRRFGDVAGIPRLVSSAIIAAGLIILVSVV